MKKSKFLQIGSKLRCLILVSPTKAGSGHPSSCLSEVELMTVLVFGGYYQKNDHLLFSKGHAAPLLYSLMVLQGKLTEVQLLTLRKFNSPLEGHPVPSLPEIEVATGSLGQGLSIGVGMALADKYLSQNSSQTYVLLGDGEISEGSIWEACNLASYYRLDNLTAIVDINRLEQDAETPVGWNLNIVEARFTAFGWQTFKVTDGHNQQQIEKAFSAKHFNKPKVILAKTVKGKGVASLENRQGWHGKVLPEFELEAAITKLRKSNDY
jgi:transketolase